jgi:AraC-like DNA-binding protein/transcriptional regulator with XRE-family HTH domain
MAMIRTGEYIRELWHKKGSPISDIASATGILPSLLNQIINGKANPTKEQVFRLAGYFNADVREMLVVYEQERLFTEQKSASHFAASVSSKRSRNMMEYLLKLKENHLEIKHWKPGYPLNLYIESIIYCNGHNLDYPFEKVLPDGTVQLVIKLDENQRFLMNDMTERGVWLKNVWITGIQKRQHTYHLSQNEVTFYVRFQPGGFYKLTQIPQFEIKNQAIDADLLLGASVLQLRETLQNAKTFSEMFRKLEGYFLTWQRQKNSGNAVVDYICENIYNPLSGLIKKTGYSQKHVIQLFKKHIGVTPKYFRRIHRFNQALGKMHIEGASKVDWSDVSFESHYYDQAHFIKEFRYFSGTNPQSFVESGRSCSKYIHF